MRVCEFCHKVFLPLNNQIVCNKCRRYGKGTICLICKNTFKYKKGKHYKQKKICPECRYKRIKNKIKIHKTIKNTIMPKFQNKYPIYKKCRICKQKFKIWTKSSKTCDKCKKEIIRLRGDKKYLTIRFEVFKRYNFTCQYCGRNVKEDKIKLVIDHPIPLSRKGDNKLNNLVASCEECNLGKKDILLAERELEKNNIINTIKRAFKQ